jgi:hypothetical protein
VTPREEDDNYGHEGDHSQQPSGDRATEEDEKQEGDEEAPADVQKRLGGEIDERSLKHIAPEALDLAGLATDGPLVHAYDDTPPLGWDRHMHIDSASRCRRPPPPAVEPRVCDWGLFSAGFLSL